MRDNIDRLLAWVLIGLMMIMTLDVIWGVITRYIMGSQASWSEELARFLLIWIGVLGSAYASGKQLHLSIDLLKPSLNRKGQFIISTVIYLLVIAFAIAVMVIGGARLMYITHTLGQLSPALQLPMALIYSVIPLSGVIIVYYKILDIAGLKEKYPPFISKLSG